MAAHRFNVSSRLALLLGESYKTIELALKELVDNSWDADAKTVWIEVPEGPEVNATIVLTDDGEGMSPEQIDKDYLRIARDRRRDRGPRTKSGRLVKGRKGVGKFAGIVISGHMELITRQRGKKSTVVIDRSDLESGPTDIDKIDVPVVSVDDDPALQGTTITLKSLFSHINYPSPEALRHALAPEYGRQDLLKIFVNGEPLTHLKIPGHVAPIDLDVPGVGQVRAEFVIAEKKQSKALRGIQVRVNGKSVGDPTMFGLELDEQVPGKLLEHVTGELLANCLEEAATSCGWTEFLESDKSVQAVFAVAREHLRAELKTVFARQMAAARARYFKKYGPRIDNLPEDKRERAREEINRILLRHYGEDERIDEAIEFLLRTLERDDHFVISRKLLAAKPMDIATLADALKELNIADLALIGKQTHARLAALETLRRLIGNGETREDAIHSAIENTLWIFGYEFALISSDQRLSTVIEKAFAGKDDSDERILRPDLLLLNRYMSRYLLIEFKRPALTLDWDHKSQAERYRAKLKPYADPIDIIVLGGKRRPDMDQLHDGGQIRMLTYTEIISRAASELEWLLGELRSDVLDGRPLH
jgi:hypothetical protein